MTEANVIYKAIADFAELRREIKGLRSDIRELEAEEAAYNKLQDKQSSSGKHTAAAKEIETESKSLALLSTKYRIHVSAVLDSSKSVKEARQETDKFAHSQKDAEVATGNLDDTLKDSKKTFSDLSSSSRERVKTSLEEISTLRNLEERFRAGKDDQERLRAAQEAAGAAARRWARDVHDASDEAAAASRHAADAIVRDAERSARAQAQPRDSLGRFASRAAPSAAPSLTPIVGGDLRGGTRDRRFDPIPAPSPAPPSGGGGSSGRVGGSSNSSGDDSKPLEKIFDAANKAGGAVLSLLGAILKLSIIGSIIGPGIAALVALGAAALGAAGALSEVAGVFAVLPGIISVAAISVGTLVIAFKGVTDVFKAYSAQQKSAAQDAKTSARAQRDAAAQIADAELALQRAKEDSVRQRIDATERITDAERNLAEIQQDQARNEIDAAERIVDADNNLERAKTHLTRAEVDLTQARKDALRSLVELRREVEHGALNEESAIAALARAQAAYQKVQADPGSTRSEKITALANLHEAEQAIVDVQDKNKRSQEDLTKATKKGIEGSDRVVNAKETLIDSEKNLREATEEATRSREDQARSEKDYADNVIDAQKELKRAREDEKRVVVDSAAAITHASLALIKATEALSDAQHSNLANVRAFQQALDRLSPSAQKVVLGLIGMKDGFTAIKKSVQEALFAPLVGQLDNVRNALPDIRDNLTKVASALGDVIAKFVEWLTSPGMRPFFKSLTDSTATIIRIVGPALIDIFQGLSDVIKVSLPFIERMATAFSKSAKSFSDFMGTAKGQAKLNDIISQGFKRASEFWTIIKNLASAFGSLLTAARPFNDWIVNGLTKGTENFKQWTEAQKLDGSPFKKYLENVKPLLQEIGHLLKTFTDYIFHQAADPKNISKAIDLFRQLRTELGPAVAKLLDVLRDKNVFGAFVTTLTAIIDALTKFIAKGGGGAFLAVIKAFGELAKAFGKIIDNTPAPVLQAIALAFGALAVLKFTGVLALIRAMTSAGFLAGIAALGGAAPVLAAAAVTIGGIALGKKAHDALKQNLDKKNAESPTGTGADNELKSRAAGGAVTGAGVGLAAGLLGGPFAPISVPVGVGVGAAVGATIAAATTPGVFDRERIKTRKVPVDGPLLPGQKQQYREEPVMKKVPIGGSSLRPGEALQTKDVPEKELTAFGKFMKALDPEIVKLKKSLGDLKTSFGHLWTSLQPLMHLLGVLFITTLKILAWNFIHIVVPAITTVIHSITSIVKVFNGLVDFVTGIFTGDWKKAFKGFKEVVSGAFDFIKSKFELIYDIFKTPIKWIIDIALNKVLIGGVNAILGFLHIPKIPLVPINFKNAGGEIPGTGDQDTVPAMLTPGEVVLQKKTVKKLGLQRALYLNEHGELPEYNKGGEVQYFAGGGAPAPPKKKKGFFGSIGSAIVGGAKAVGSGIVGAAKAVAHGVVEGIEFVGDLTRGVAAKAIGFVFDRVRGLMKHIPGGDILGLPIGVVNRVFEGITSLVSGKDEQPQKKAKGGVILAQPNLTQMFAAGGLVHPPSWQMPRQIQAGSIERASSIEKNTNNTTNRGFTVENLNIHNPRPEPASDSLPNSIRKISYLSS